MTEFAPDEGTPMDDLICRRYTRDERVAMALEALRHEGRPMIGIDENAVGPIGTFIVVGSMFGLSEVEMDDLRAQLHGDPAPDDDLDDDGITLVNEDGTEHRLTRAEFADLMSRIPAVPDTIPEAEEGHNDA